MAIPSSSSSVATSNVNSEIKDKERPTTKPRHYGYDNCKLIFMLLVVLWHTAHFNILEASLLWSASVTGANDTEASSHWWDRVSNGQLSHHFLWTPFVSHCVARYWLWTEKLAVPGFAFLSGYFGKSFLQTSSIDRGGDAVEQLTSLQVGQRKERVRWERTISTLLLGPLLWQALSWFVGGLVSSIYYGAWSFAANDQLELWDYLGSWYLFALLLWRVWTSIFLSKLRQDRQFPLLVSIILAVLSAHTNRGGPQEMRMRLFYFFPYYVAGLYCTEETWNTLIRQSCRIGGVKSKQVDRCSRFLGGLGIILTLLICQVVPREHLGWKYTIDTYALQPHLVFLFQYLLAGAAVVSVILVVKTVRVPLFPFGHSNSTLAIYEAHWPVANLLAWGTLPYTAISTTNTSAIQWCFSDLSPVPTLLCVHLICYLICVALGSRLMWDRLLRHACDPQWICRWLFQPQEQAESYSPAPPGSSIKKLSPPHLV
ncbi:expressed unknown protein [Seminavis robusta]|uniref:Acyltransferase 3 domain-containing protein n=1 Tax=Seminavis robusta TaxID=568900 RepID=A0A9N8HFB7_9STRA|nr:expressed unknown protein [Seminavis robusta]|eukprot:Sro428_g140780.1 n/a (484) ;mRNA; f:6150-7601